MRLRTYVVVLLCAMACGCGNNKSTDELITDLQSGQEIDRIKAVRLLQHRTGEPEQVVPALIEALRDRDSDVRWGAAIGLGYFGDKARAAIPALQATLNDRDARVREGARNALIRIDPSLPPQTTSPPNQGGRGK